MVHLRNGKVGQEFKTCVTFKAILTRSALSHTSREVGRFKDEMAKSHCPVASAHAF